MNARVVGIFLIVVLVILVGFGLIRALSGQVKPSSPKPSPTPKVLTLLDYVDSDSVQVNLITDGRIVALENHVSQTLSVAKVSRNITYFKSYSATPALNQSFDNNQPAFQDFMAALQNAGFTASKINLKAAKSTTGLCPTGYRYTYEVVVNGEVLSSLWSTSCGDQTTFAGNAGNIRSLFQLQIPDYNKIAAQVPF